MGEPSKALQEKHRTLRRLVIAQGDLFQALRFSELILGHEGLEVDNEEEARKYKDIVTALNIAMVVAYSRPFLKSKAGRANSSTLAFLVRSCGACLKGRRICTDRYYDSGTRNLRTLMLTRIPRWSRIWTSV
jgi:hypothetical protein